METATAHAEVQARLEALRRDYTGKIRAVEAEFVAQRSAIQADCGKVGHNLVHRNNEGTGKHCTICGHYEPLPRPPASA